MTIKQSRLLKGALQELAQKYDNNPIQTLLNAVQETYEENESDDAATLGNKLGDVILNSGVIKLTASSTDASKSLEAFKAYWVDKAAEVKAA